MLKLNGGSRPLVGCRFAREVREGEAREIDSSSLPFPFPVPLLSPSPSPSRLFFQEVSRNTRDSRNTRFSLIRGVFSSSSASYLLLSFL